MSILRVLAQAPPTPVDPAAVAGLPIASILSLIAQGGAAVMLLAAGYYFLGHLRSRDEKDLQKDEAHRKALEDVVKKFQDQLDRLSDHQRQATTTFQDQVARITETQSAVLRDAIVAMKSVEKTVDGSTNTVRAIEGTVSSLRTAVNTLELLVRQTVGAWSYTPNRTITATLVHSGTSVMPKKVQR